MKSFILSDIGVARKENQDAAIILENKHVTFAAVCDGMGGHPGGRQAANLTIQAFKKEFARKAPNTEKDWRLWISETINRAMQAMKQEAKQNPPLLDMGTTVTSTIIYKDKIIVFNIGDSRTYIYNGLLHQITVDHNLRNYYIKEHGLSEEKANQIYGGEALTSALGPIKRLKNDAYELDLTQEINYIILTSDGIHDYITKPHFELIISSKKKTLEEKAGELIKEAIKGGSKDNLTIVILELNNG